MFQDYALFHIWMFWECSFRLADVRRRTSNNQCSGSEVLDLVNLSGFEHREISHIVRRGSTTRSLARALAPQPSLLMLDEPLGSVDRTLKERLLAELSRILRQLSQTAIYVTHDQKKPSQSQTELYAQ